MSEAPISPAMGAVVLAIFSAVWLVLGVWLGRKSRSYDDYALAGRNVGLALGTATATATWVTTNTTMSAPQLTYQLGVWGMLGYSLAAVGLIMFAPLAVRIRRLMPSGYTAGDFIRTRYGRPAWIVFLVISLLYALGWLVSMGMAGGILLQSLTGIPYLVGMIVITVVCVGYTLVGGLHAVIGTDFVQSLIILIGLVVIGVATFVSVPVADVHAHLLESRPQLLDLLMPASVMFLFNQLLFGVGEIFHSNVWWSRALAMREGVGGRAFAYGGLLWIPVPIAAGAIALAAPVLGLNVPALDAVGPIVLSHVLGGAGAMLLLIVVLSSLASSLDSLLAATSDLLVEDVYRRLLRPQATDAQMRAAARAIVVGLGLLSIVLCWGRVSTLAEVLNLTGALVAATIWPILTGLYGTKTNGTTAALAMVLGSAAGLCGYFLIGFFTAALIGAAVSMLCVAIGRSVAPAQFDFAAFKEGA